MASTRESLLRKRRLECGLTQTELAARAGVSRQLVAAVEAGHNTPAVDAAIGLARALATSVEELFAVAAPEVVAALGGRLRDGVPLRVGRVAGQFVAAELADHGIAGASWAKPDGVLADGELRLFPAAAPAGFVLAGCDPAIGVAEAMLQGLGPNSLLAISAPTGTALRALRLEVACTPPSCTGSPASFRSHRFQSCGCISRAGRLVLPWRPAFAATRSKQC